MGIAVSEMLRAEELTTGKKTRNCQGSKLHILLSSCLILMPLLVVQYHYTFLFAITFVARDLG